MHECQRLWKPTCHVGNYVPSHIWSTRYIITAVTVEHSKPKKIWKTRGNIKHITLPSHHLAKTSTHTKAAKSYNKYQTSLERYFMPCEIAQNSIHFI